MNFYDLQAGIDSAAVMRARIAALESALEQSTRDCTRLEVGAAVMRDGIDAALRLLFPGDHGQLLGLIDDEAAVTLPRAVRLAVTRPQAAHTRLCVLAADAEKKAATTLGRPLLTGEPEQAIRDTLHMLAAEVVRLGEIVDRDSHRLQGIHEHLFVTLFPGTGLDAPLPPEDGAELAASIVKMIDTLAGNGGGEP